MAAYEPAKTWSLLSVKLIVWYMKNDQTASEFLWKSRQHKSAYKQQAAHLHFYRDLAGSCRARL